jgi:hypothetical protein
MSTKRRKKNERTMEHVSQVSKSAQRSEREQERVQDTHTHTNTNTNTHTQTHTHRVEEFKRVQESSRERVQ